MRQRICASTGTYCSSRRQRRCGGGFRRLCLGLSLGLGLGGDSALCLDSEDDVPPALRSSSSPSTSSVKPVEIEYFGKAEASRLRLPSENR